MRWASSAESAEAGEVEAAVRQLERAVSAEPQSAAWRFLLAQGYQRLGNATAAAREFAEARRLKAQEVERERGAVLSFGFDGGVPRGVAMAVPEHRFRERIAASAGSYQ